MIDVERGDDVIAGREGVENGGGRRRARGERGGGSTAFQCGEAAFQHVAVGVSRTSVDVAAGVGSVRGALEGGGGVDGRGDGTGERVRLVAGMDDEGFESHGEGS